MQEKTSTASINCVVIFGTEFGSPILSTTVLWPEFCFNYPVRNRSVLRCGLFVQNLAQSSNLTIDLSRSPPALNLAQLSSQKHKCVKTSPEIYRHSRKEACVQTWKDLTLTSKTKKTTQKKDIVLMHFSLLRYQLFFTPPTHPHKFTFLSHNYPKILHPVLI